KVADRESRLGKRGQDARLVVQGGASRARECEGRLERGRRSGDVPGSKRRRPEKRGRLDPREWTAALLRPPERAAAMSEGAREVALEPQHLAQESVSSVEGLETFPLLVDEKGLEGRLSLRRVPEVGGCQRPPDAHERRRCRAAERFLQPGQPNEVGPGTLGDAPGGREPAGREQRVRQHRAHLERERTIPGRIGDLARSLGAREVLLHVAGESAQASVGREEKRVTARIAQTLGDGARLLEELV